MITTEKAREEDIIFLWYLRNQEDVYKYSKNPKGVSFEDHIKWIMPIILRTEKNKRLYVIKNDDRINVGQVRFDFKDSTAEISISILKEFRNKGTAKDAIEQGIRMERENADKFTAEIHRENESSKRLFEKLGFVKIKSKSNSLFEKYERSV